MVQIDVVRSCDAKLVTVQPLVAVFVGGTSGIGDYTARALAATHSNRGKGLRLYIVGRNASAAKAIISDCVHDCPDGHFRFVQANDLALLKDVDSVCAEIIRLEEDESAKGGGKARVDILVMSQACPIFGPRKETEEGLDTLMSLMYYSRMRVIIQLLPLLLASSLPAHVISVYAAGMEGKLFPEDLSLRDAAHQGYLKARSHITFMTTVFMENLAERHQGRLSLTHVFPGLVMTPGFDHPQLPTWFKLLWNGLFRYIAPLFSVPPRECGERTLFLATPRFPARQTTESGTNIDAQTAAAAEGEAGTAVGTDGMIGGGAYSVNWDGETIPTSKAYNDVSKKDLSGKVWDHTMKAFEEIAAGNVFTG